MGIIAIACYKPKKGKSKELVELVKGHYTLLLAQGFVTERDPVVMKSEEGTIIEIFEWKSKKSKELAHSNKHVVDIWSRFEKISDNISLSEVEEAEETFANFAPV